MKTSSGFFFFFFFLQCPHSPVVSFIPFRLDSVPVAIELPSRVSRLEMDRKRVGRSKVVHGRDNSLLLLLLPNDVVVVVVVVVSIIYAFTYKYKEKERELRQQQ